MYPPLKFIEQTEGYFQLYNARNKEQEVNNKAMKIAEDFISFNRQKLYHDYGSIRSFDTSIAKKKKIIDSYNEFYNNFFKSLMIHGCMDSEEDFLDLLIYYDARNIWRKNKLSYLIDDNLFYTLLNMEPPKLAPMDCMTKLPANCFYIDYNGVGSELCDDLDGTIVLTDKNDNELNIVLIHLIHSNIITDRELILTTIYRLSLSGESNKFVPMYTGKYDKTTMKCEDNIVRTIYDEKICKFLYNFLIYLHAANRDVEISERTRKSHEKVQSSIKNKFREVKEFEVGFTYGRSISKNNKRIKYVGEKQKMDTVHSPKSSHYRSAHWHHFWTGSGEDKKLIIKWVEGVFVNGGKDEAKNVQIHKVK